jgi:hypothetical protein
MSGVILWITTVRLARRVSSAAAICAAAGAGDWVLQLGRSTSGPGIRVIVVLVAAKLVFDLVDETHGEWCWSGCLMR